jgi:hypothetical protein
MIYLISTDGHRDSIDLEYYFTDYERIENYVKWYKEECFNEKVKNVEVNFEDLIVTFEYEAFWGEWEKGTYYLFKVNQHE